FHSRDAARWQRFQTQLEQWMNTWSPPVAVLTLTDLLGRYLGEACRARGLKVPSDVALVGSGNEPLICTISEPALSSIDYGFGRIGYRAAQLLDQMLDGAAPPKQPVRL